MNYFDVIRNKWNEILIGSNDYTSPSEDIKRVIDEVDLSTKNWLDTFIYNNNDYIWEDKSDFAVTQTQTDCYRRILDMSKSYSMKASKYYKDPRTLNAILEGLRFVHKKAYNPSAYPYYGNWWNWEIGNPITLGNIISILGDSIPKEERELYCETIKFFQPNPYYSGLRRKKGLKVGDRFSVGANRIDTAKVAVLLGINMNDKSQLEMARDSISDTFVIIDKEEDSSKVDGLYQDWSYIQHEDVPYTGTYGNVLLGGIGELVNVLSDTPFEITDPNLENIYKMILNSFQPLMYKGHCMECVNGRGSSRQEWGNNRTGHSIISSILWFTKFAPKEYADKYKSMVKYWIMEDEIRDFIKTNNNINLIEVASDILEDDSIAKRGKLIGSYSFNSMDRLVHRMPTYSAAVAMNSKRIRTYETMLGENKKGYYTSDGMIYIYNGDQYEYTHDYWATVDPYKLSGITLDTKELNDGDGYFRSPESWVSNMSFDNKVAIAGMQLNKKAYDEKSGLVKDILGIDLKAKKSYFLLEEEIVLLGADIKSTSKRNIKTILDTRKLKNDLSNEVEIGKDYIFVEGNRDNYSMGYYLLDNENIEVEKYVREASWNEINENGNKDIKKQAYITIYKDHKVAPKDEGYAYIIIPNITKENLKNYNTNQDIEILSNTKEVQAIKYKNILMANFWEDKNSEIDKIKVNKKASVIVEENKDTVNIAICDPTKENNDYIDIELDIKGAKVLSKSKEIDVVKIDNTIKLRVNTNKTKGKKLNISIAK